MVLARTKAPSSLRTHIPMSTRFIDYEKEASILHSRQPGANLCQCISWPTVDEKLNNMRSLVCEAQVVCWSSLTLWMILASCWSSMRRHSQSTTLAQSSFSFFQRLRLQCFHKLQQMTTKCQAYSWNRFCNKEK